MLASLAARTAPDGDLVFTVETLKEGDWRWCLQHVERYAHHPRYVSDVARTLGLEVVSQTAFTPRQESGVPVMGTLHVLHKPP